MKTLVATPAASVLNLVMVSAARLMCPCGCKDTASRFVRCRHCKGILARCGSAGSQIALLRDEHEAGCEKRPTSRG